MYFIPGYYYHIYNRGNNKEKIFFKDENYDFFLRKVIKELAEYLNFIAYCLMPNHFHFLIQVKEIEVESSDDFKSSDDYSKLISNHIAILLRSYTRAINIQEERSGSLFQQKTKAKCLNENSNSKNDYTSECFFYIHQNPLKAGLVNNLDDWKHSSFLDYAGLRNSNIVNKDLAFELINYDQNNFIEHSYVVIDEKNLKGIWV